MLLGAGRRRADTSPARQALGEEVIPCIIEPRSGISLTGGAPFRAKNNRASLARILHFQPHPLHDVRPDVPRGLSDLIECLLEKVGPS